jgi:radical SAM superfamily enzyme YgiQ (UPF0313 family)
LLDEGVDFDLRVLLIKPRSSATQFGLAPFFRTEPLGLEYIGAALGAGGHQVRIVDLGFERRTMAVLIKTLQPEIVGISCLHILDVPVTLQLACEIKQIDPAVFVAVGGHAAAAYPKALEPSRWLDAVCVGEGESTMPSLCDALAQHKPLQDVPSLLLPAGDGRFAATGETREWLDLNQVLCPDRAAVETYRKHYVCLNYMPVWTLETTRGCRHRCNFCSVWQFYTGSCRFHAPRNVRADFEHTGKNVFIVDDLFWGDKARSEELGRELLASHERKNWILAQSRVDQVSESFDLLRLWRPLAQKFDIFFGFESPTKRGLDSLNKGTDPSKTLDAIRVARECGFGVTGNFIVDPDFSEEDFAELWNFIEAHQLYRVGFTILTPLPGTYYFEQSKAHLKVLDWNQYDLHHLLWKPRLPVKRFFELYCETWRRSVLNAGGRKKWWEWLREVDMRHIGHMARILARAQKLMDPQAYLAEFRIPADLP